LVSKKPKSEKKLVSWGLAHLGKVGEENRSNFKDKKGLSFLEF
jgi:hypothetical protein